MTPTQTPDVELLHFADDKPLEPTCDYKCPEKKGTCFPKPCKIRALKTQTNEKERG